MNYRSLLPVAFGGAAVLVAGFYGIFNGKTRNLRYSGSHLNDNGLKQYTFVDSKKFELLNATVLLRHGARTPNYFIDSKFDMPDWESGYGYVDVLPQLDYDADVKELPSMKLIDEDTIMDEYIIHSKGKCQWGQLTLIGQEQSLVLGQELRRIYMHGYNLLSQEFNDNEIYCRSTKFPRTFYTLKGILSGIYGIKSFDRCNRPIIHTMGLELDPLYPNPHICSVLGKFIVSGVAEIAQDHEIIKMKCLLKQFLGVDSLRFTSPDKKTKKEIKVCENKIQTTKINEINTEEEFVAENVPIYAVRDDFYARQVHEFPVFSNFSSLLPELNRLSSEEILFEYLGGSVEWEERIALLVSPIINIMKTNFKEGLGRSNESGKGCNISMRESLTRKKLCMKMQLISCHDTTLIPLLVCFRIYDGQWPKFSSNIIFELYKERDSGNIFTRCLYNGKIQKISLSQEDKCSPDDAYSKIGLMPYADFLTILDKYSISDDKYSSACDKALKLFSSGKPITKEQLN